MQREPEAAGPPEGGPAHVGEVPVSEAFPKDALAVAKAICQSTGAATGEGAADGRPPGEQTGRGERER